jgi:hypothetical protein
MAYVLKTDSFCNEHCELQHQDFILIQGTLEDQVVENESITNTVANISWGFFIRYNKRYKDMHFKTSAYPNLLAYCVPASYEYFRSVNRFILCLVWLLRIFTDILLR